MTITIQDVIGDYTPLSNRVVSKSTGLGLVRGAVACKIFFTSGLKDRVCRLGLARLSDEVGIEKSTASKTIKQLVKDGYVEIVQKPTRTSPGHYRVTQKFYDLASPPEIEPETPTEPAEGGVDVINTGVDLINQEEDLKEDLKTYNNNKGLDPDFSKICKTYEAEIGGLSPAIRDKILDAVGRYPHDWILKALTRAAEMNKRSWGYVAGILKNWAAIGGPQNDKPRRVKNGQAKTTVDRRANGQAKNPGRDQAGVGGKTTNADAARQLAEF